MMRSTSRSRRPSYLSTDGSWRSASQRISSTEKPAASEVARWQALTSDEVTDLRHRAVKLDGVAVRKFICLLDGSRDQRMLLDAMNAFLEETRRSGADVPGLPQRATAEEVAAHLKDVARLGLLWA